MEQEPIRNIELLPKRLATAIETSGLTQKEVAERADISTVQLYKYLHGETLPGSPALARLADALIVTADFLLGRADTSKLTPLELKREIDHLTAQKGLLVREIGRMRKADGMIRQILDNL